MPFFAKRQVKCGIYNLIYCSEYQKCFQLIGLSHIINMIKYMPVKSEISIQTSADIV
jgi:hypothetical protein